MSPQDLEAYLHAHIPQSRALGVSVLAIGTDGVELAAPLAANINHRDTVFGGSASAVAILAAWSLLHVRLSALGRPSRLVIQRNSMDYLAPMADDFTARSFIGPDEDWDRFLRMLDRRGVARITVGAELSCAGVLSGRLSGEFVAFGGDQL